MIYVCGSVYLILGVCCMMFYSVCGSPDSYMATAGMSKVETVSLLSAMVLN